jgi:hypothetical protein
MRKYDLLTRADLARILRVTPDTIWERERYHWLPVVVFGGRLKLYAIEAVSQWLEEIYSD